MSKKIVIPWELKYDFAMRGYSSIKRGFLHLIRNKYGAAATLELLEELYRTDDRLKNLTNVILEIFKIKGNDAETIANFLDIWGELCGFESTSIERSKTFYRVKITKCPWKTQYKDISDWPLIWNDIILKTINPKLTVDRPKKMCAGDPYCEYVYKLEE